MALPTLVDIKKLDNGIGFDIIEESILLAPELRIIPAETIRGTEMTLSVRTDLPSVAFRNFNEGTARTASKYEDRVFQTAILDHQVAIDQQLLRNAIDPTRFKVNHMSGAVEAAFRYIAKQFWYGVTNDAKGFIGLIAQMLSTSAANVDAGGAANKSSVYFLRLGRETVQFLFGNGTTINMQDSWDVDTVLDASNNPYQAEVNWLTGAVGMRVANKNSVVRIKNLAAGAGGAANTLNDTLMYSAWRSFQKNYGAPPSHIFMNSRSQEQLRGSRTNTGSNEKGNVPPLPMDFNGVPIIISEAISEAETI